MSKRLSDEFLLGRVDWILRETGQHKRPVPVDLQLICDKLGVSVEWRRMIPEGAVVENANGLSIYLQDNFQSDPRTGRRQRFTWAHEICHALFFQLDKKPPNPFPGTPKGAIIESMCQRGAGYLLLPQVLLESLFGMSNPLESIEQLNETATKFEISAEVVLRRLSEHPEMFASHRGFLLVSSAGGNTEREMIRFYGGGSWVTGEIPAPKDGQALDEWTALVNKSLKPLDKDRWLSRNKEVEITLSRGRPNSPILQLSAHLI